jgi:pimeloyl-ACP methyl ester carboxylesterase
MAAQTMTAQTMTAQTMTALSRNALRLPEGEISFLEGGAAPALHFAHATGFNAGTYAPLLAPLCGDLGVLASDARGHGFSTLPAQPGSARHWTIYRDDLLRFLAQKTDRPAILAGHSMGATASLAAAIAAPERVRGLILIEPVLIGLMPLFSRLLFSRLLRFRSPGPDLAARAMRRRAVFPSLDAALSSYRGRGAFRTWPEAFLRAYLEGGLLPTGNGGEMRLACAPQWEAETFRSTPLGMARQGARVHCPVTLIYAEESTPPESECRDFARRHGNTKLIKVPGTTHFLPMERPDIVIAEIRRMAGTP